MVYCFAFRARRYLKISIYKYSPFYTLRNNRVACSSGLSFLSRCFTICEYMHIYIYILICTYTKPFIVRHMFRMSCFYTSLAFAPRSESGRFEQMWGMCVATFENVVPRSTPPFQLENNYVLVSFVLYERSESDPSTNDAKSFDSFIFITRKLHLTPHLFLEFDISGEEFTRRNTSCYYNLLRFSFKKF